MSDKPDPRAHIDALFAQALDLEGTERNEFLARLSASAPALAIEVEGLLRLAVDTDSRLTPEMPGHPELWSMLASEPAVDTRIVDDERDCGRRVGVWLLQRVLGRGGMGTVYLAHRNDGEFEQCGALKRIRGGVDSRDFLRRFALERQILASLQHPGIARLLDGGSDSEGRPYLVMEYVEGQPLTLHCDLHRLGIAQRLLLFQQIARAVADAHRNLIVHRDLKPSNIVVSVDGAVKLLDFGIAKVLSATERPGEPTTRATSMLFTPEYATPEQVLGQPVTTATDVYQLGLLLYELLTGQAAQNVEGKSIAGLERAICQTPAVPPSVVVTDADECIFVARRTTKFALRRQLRGDLDQIVLKAVRKDPQRRYASANALVEDIERFQQGLPVRAQSETLLYRGGKFLRRYPFGVTAVVTVMALLVSYAVTVTRQARSIALERDNARAESAKSLQVQSLLVQLFAGADPEQSGGVQMSARELLDRGWARISAESSQPPEVRAVLLDTVGEAYRQLGQYDRAASLFDQALLLTQAMDGAATLRLRALRSSGRLSSDLGDYATAEQRLSEALAGYRSQSGADNADIADTLSDHGLLLNRKGDFVGATAQYTESLAMRRRLFGERHVAVAESLDELGMMKRTQADYAGAEPLLARALAMRRELLPVSHPHLARSLSNLALVRNDMGDFDGAESLYREAAELMRKTLGDDHPQLAIVLNNLAKVLQTRRDYKGALALLRQAVDIRRKALGNSHPMVALNLNDLGLLNWEIGDFETAAADYSQAMAAWPSDHPWRSATVFNLGRLAESRGDYTLAERTYREVLALQSKQYGPEHDRVAIDLNRLGAVLHHLGRLDEAESLMRQALAIYRKRLPPGHQRLAAVLLPLATLLDQRGQTTESETLLREALKVRLDAFGADDPRTVEVREVLLKLAPHSH